MKSDNLKSYLPLFYEGYAEMQTLLEAEGIEFDQLTQNSKEVLDQLFIFTATWGIELWEKSFFITPNLSDSLDIRRSRILSKMSGLGTFNKEDALELANKYSLDRSAEFIPILGEYAFKTRHNIDSLVDYDTLRSTFEEMKPAHLEHILGLLIIISMELNHETKMRIYTHLITDFELNYTKQDSIHFKAGLIGPGNYPFTPDSNGIYTDGSWGMDGNTFMKGENPERMRQYVEQTESLTIRTYKNNNLIKEEVI
ncbi:putative phage tail protein [Chengkuizengella sp. SCS-71B]|uniref:putative phage tail protein n=1 Tax=Chengkuizengella sp. SCS-71B TaxID=3115290 RepID=UPI0032C2101E